MSLLKRGFFCFFIIIVFSLNLSFSREVLQGSVRQSSETIKEETLPNIFTVVIDPGHGGEDGGAVGHTGLKEKDVTIRVCEILKEFIQERLGARVIFTRKENESRSIDERIAIANQSEANLFISIHVDASFDPKKTGNHVFYFDSDYLNITPRRLNQKKDQKIILWDHVQLEFVQRSRILAEAVKTGMDEQGLSENRWVKKAPLSLLKGIKMPAVMVTLGYISHPEEEIRLKDTVYLTSIAEGIFKGIEKYREQAEKDETQKS